MARRRAAVEEDADETDASDELDAYANAQLEAQMQVSSLLDQFSEGGRRVSIKIRRSLRAEDRGLKGLSAGYCGMLPNDLVTEIRPETLEEDVAGIHGGGSFSLDFWVGGEFQRGRSVKLEIQGPAKVSRVGGPAAAPEPAVAVAPSAGALTLESLTAILAQREKDSELDRLRREVEDLRRNPAPAASVRAETTGELMDKVFEKVSSLTATSRKAAEDSPELKALREEMREERSKRERLEEKERDREEKDRERRDQEFRDRLEEVARRGKKKRSVASGAIDLLAQMAATDAMIRKIEQRADDDDGSGGVMAELIQPIKRMLVDGLGAEAKRLVRHLKTKARAQEAATLREGETLNDPAAWALWVDGILTQPMRLADEATVRDALRRFPAFVGELIVVGERGQLVAFATRTLGPDVAKVFSDWTPEQFNGALSIVGELRKRVMALAATAPAPAVHEPRQAAEDEDADEADEDEEEDDVKTVEGSKA